MTILSQPAVLNVVRNITPDKITPYAVPGGSFSPQHSSVEPLDRGVAEFVFGKAWIQDNDVAIRVANWRCALAIIATLPHRRRG
jgi:hypothetical protein